jgi:hypothetical protein
MRYLVFLAMSGVQNCRTQVWVPDADGLTAKTEMHAANLGLGAGLASSRSPRVRGRWQKRHPFHCETICK